MALPDGKRNRTVRLAGRCWLSAGEGIATGRGCGAHWGTALTIEMTQGERGHALGRFRLWVARGPEPQLPAGYGRRLWQIAGEAPATCEDGLLVVSVELLRDGRPLEVANLGSHLLAEATVAGEAATFEPALGEQTYPCALQSWRLETGPQPAGRPVELTVQFANLPDCELHWSAHFIPHGRQ